MSTDLARHIQETPLVDTHEHLKREPEWLQDGPDILQDLFDNYVSADLRTAGASPDAMRRLLDASDPDIAGRFRGVEEAWRATQFTGYGEAVRLIARQLYGIEELSGDALAAAAGRTGELRRPGERYRLLHDVANLDQVQTDDLRWPCLPDHSGLDFFLYDLSWFSLCRGDVEPRLLYEETGVEVSDLTSLRRAMETIFEQHAPCAIAVKSQHAYARTLQWSERSDGEAAAALDAVLQMPAEQVDRAAWLCLGDWCWARGVELAIEHHLPFKIHTGYYAGNDRMPTPWIAAGNMCALFERYLDARFVLMHIAYPSAMSWRHWRSTTATSGWTCAGRGASTPTAPATSCAASSTRYRSTSCSPLAATPVGPAPRWPTRSRRGAESAARWRRKSPTVSWTSARPWQSPPASCATTNTPASTWRGPGPTSVALPAPARQVEDSSPWRDSGCIRAAFSVRRPVPPRAAKTACPAAC